MSPGLTGVVLPAFVHTVEDGSGSPKNASNTTEVRKPQERAEEDFTQVDSWIKFLVKNYCNSGRKYMFMCMSAYLKVIRVTGIRTHAFCLNRL